MSTSNNATFAGRAAPVLASGKENVVNNHKHRHHHHQHPQGPTTKKARSESSSSTRRTLKSPYDLKMEALDAKIAELDAEGEILVELMDSGRGRGQHYDTETQERLKKNLTQAQVDTVRWIILTKERDRDMEDMAKLVLGHQYDSPLMMFDTSFSYRVNDIFEETFRSKYNYTQDPAERFNLLFGFTHAIDQHDVWMHDNESPLTTMVSGLARMWKRLLHHHLPEALQVDEEFSWPGIHAYLKKFQNKVQNELPSYGQMKFPFN